MWIQIIKMIKISTFTSVVPKSSWYEGRKIHNFWGLWFFCSITMVIGKTIKKRLFQLFGQNHNNTKIKKIRKLHVFSLSFYLSYFNLSLPFKTKEKGQGNNLWKPPNESSGLNTIPLRKKKKRRVKTSKCAMKISKWAMWVCDIPQGKKMKR